MIDSQNNNQVGFTPPGSNQNGSSTSHAADSNTSSTNQNSAAERGGARENSNDVDDEVAAIMTRSCGDVPITNSDYYTVCSDRVCQQRAARQNRSLHDRNSFSQLTRRDSSNRERGRNLSEPRRCTREPYFCNTQRDLGYDYWDESSTATSVSDCHARHPARRRSYQENYSRTFDNSIPPFLSQHLDMDDTSTEMSSNISGYNNSVCHRYGSLPANSSFSGRSRNVPYENMDNRLRVDENFNRRDVEHCLPCVNEHINDCDAHEDFDVSVSNISSSQRHIRQTDCATNVLENDSVLAQEDNNRKLEQIYDSQQLRILRLSKLLQNPGEDSEVCSAHDAECSLTCCTSQINGNNIRRSQSQNSCLSICSETGEKKLCQMADSAIDNDAQYPENAIRGHLPLSEFRSTNNSASESVHARPVIVNNPTYLPNTALTHSATLPHNERSDIHKGRGNNHRLHGHSNELPYNLRDANTNDSLSKECRNTSEKLVQTDKKLVGKSKTNGKSNKSDIVEGRRKRHSKSGARSHNSNRETNHNTTDPKQEEVVGNTDMKSYGFVDELKLIHRNHGNVENVTSQETSLCHPYSRGVAHTMDRYRTSAYYPNAKQASVKRSDSYSSGKSRSSSGGETSLLCPAAMSVPKRKNKVSKRGKGRRSCPVFPPEVQAKARGYDTAAHDVRDGRDNGMEIW